MGKTTSIRWRSIATTLAMAMLLALMVAPPAAFAHRGEHNNVKSAVDNGGIGVEVLSASTDVAEFLSAYQWAGTPAVDDEGYPKTEEGAEPAGLELAYVPGGCTPADYADADVEGKIALVDQAAAAFCPPSTFFQKVQYAQQAGALGFLQVPKVQARSNATAIQADIPALDLIRVTETNDNGTPADEEDDFEEATQDDAAHLRDAVKANETVTVRFIDRRPVYETTSDQPCANGFAGDTAFRCDGVDLLGFISHEEFNSAGISDLWGWTDPGEDDEAGTNDAREGDEYVIMGKTNGVAFFNVTDPTRPVYLGELDNPGLIQAVWHDIKVYENHAFIVSESENHGMTVFDLTKLRGLTASDPEEPTEFEFDARYELTSAAHNLEINEEIGMAYILGGNAGIVAPDHCLSGLHMVDINEPKNPTFRGCYVLEGGPGTAARVAGSPVTEVSPAAYVHDAQCVVYDEGPDTEHHGKHICVTAAENKIVVADVTNPAVPRTLGTTEYPHVAYAHQGWFDETETYWFVNDELAQMTFPEEAPNTRTIVIDLSDLDNPAHHLDYHPREDEGGMKAITHNNYVVGDLLYQSNYSSGLRVADISDIATKQMEEIAFFDTYPNDDDTNFDGTWSNYPFFESGTIAVSGRAEGLFLLKLADEGEERGVEVACEDCPVEIRSGETGEAHIGVRNTGDVDDTYTVTVAGLPEGWTATAAPNPVTVAAGEHGHTDLAITTPRKAQAGSYTFTVTATSGSDPAVSDSGEVTVEVVKGKPSSPGRPATAAGSGSDASAVPAASVGGSFTATPASAAGTPGSSTVPTALLVGLALSLLIPPVVRRRLVR